MTSSGVGHSVFAATDTKAPTAPEHLSAKGLPTNEIGVYWGLSFDENGVTDYTLERSLDNKTWKMVVDGGLRRSYIDKDVVFQKKYYYRARAKDAAGNVSDATEGSATGDVFEANTPIDADKTVTSEDGKLSAFIPAGALEQEAACRIITTPPPADRLPQYAKLVAGSYELECVDENLSISKTYQKTIVLRLNVPPASNRRYEFYQIKNNQLSPINQQYKKTSPNFEISSTNPEPVVLLSYPQDSLLSGRTLIIGAAAIGGLLVLISAALFVRARSSQRQQSDAYVDQHYLPSAQAGNPLDRAPVPPTVAGGVGSAPPHHAAGETYDPNVHHNPLDRLREEEEARAQAAKSKPPTEPPTPPQTPPTPPA